MEKEKRDWEALASELRGLLQGFTTSYGTTVYAPPGGNAIFVEPLPGHEDANSKLQSIEENARIANSIKG